MAFSLIALAFALMLFVPTPLVSAVAGFIFGFGYSLGFPVLSVWLSDVFDIESRPIAMSLFNAYFHCGIFGIPLIVGMFESQLLLKYSLTLLIAVAMGVGCNLYFYRNEEKSIGVGA